jgi:hypothetical protein
MHDRAVSLLLCRSAARYFCAGGVVAFCCFLIGHIYHRYKWKKYPLRRTMGQSGCPQPPARITCSASDVCTFRWTHSIECDFSYVTNPWNCHAIEKKKSSSHLGECSGQKVPSRAVSTFAAYSSDAGGHLATGSWRHWRPRRMASASLCWWYWWLELLLAWMLWTWATWGS